jgi:WD40 repeat protein
LQIVDINAPKLIGHFTDTTGPIADADFLDEGRKVLAVVGCAGEAPSWFASVWDIATSRKLYQLPAHDNALSFRGAHSSANVFAVGVGSVIEIYELHSGHLVEKINSHFKQGVQQFVFSRDGRQLASIGRNDYEFKVWDWARQPERPMLIGGNGKVLSCAAFSADGRTFITGEDNLVRFWNTQTGQELIRLPVSGQPGQLRFSADGKQLAASCRDTATGPAQVRIWSAEP